MNFLVKIHIFCWIQRLKNFFSFPTFQCNNSFFAISFAEAKIRENLLNLWNFLIFKNIRVFARFAPFRL